MTLVSKSFSDIVTFSRSSNATRVGPTGLVEYAPHNLILQSQTFDNASWTKANSSITANAIAAPDGTVTADKLIANATTNVHYIVQGIGTSAQYTFSCYMKAAEYTSAVMLAVGANHGAAFNLANGTVSTVYGSATATITSVGNGWYRCVIALSVSGTDFYIYANNAGAYLGDGTSGIYLWGAQLSVGPYALDYTPTTSAAVYGPRFDYDPSGVTIVDPVSTNLLLYSEQFDNAAWIKSGTTVTANAAAAPNGTVTADLVAYSGSSEIAQIVAATNGTLSFWAKGVLGETLFVGIAGSGASNIITLSDSWQRYSLSFSGTSTYIYIGRYAGATVTSVYLWGAQLELGSQATSYMVSGATNGFRAVPVTSGTATAKGLLVEEQRTNLLTYSEGLQTWGGAFMAVSTNALAAPSGQVTAQKLIASTVLNFHYIAQTVGTVASSVYNFSVYMKIGEQRYANLLVNNSGGFSGVGVDLQTGTIVTNSVGVSQATGYITSVGSGWYRVSMVVTAASTTVEFRITASNDSNTSWSFAGDGSSGFYVWGAQVEAGSFATSYIPTLASTVTRSADVASVNTLSPWYSSECTIYCEASVLPGNVNNNNTKMIFGGGAVGNSPAVLEYLGVLRTLIQGVGFPVDAGTNLTTTTKKIAGRLKTGNQGIAVNGSVTSDTDAMSAGVGSTFFIGSSPPGSGDYLNGYIRKIAFYPRALTNAELAALTA